MGQQHRVLLKLSGEAFLGEESYGIGASAVNRLAKDVVEVRNEGIGVGVVVGGGNIFRGRQAEELGIEEAQAHYMGMLATLMNGLALQHAIEVLGVETRVQTAIRMDEIAEPFIRRRAIRHIEKGRIVIFGAGTGNPFFTTDSGAALRAIEIGADVLLAAKNIDGVYDSDPAINPSAKKYDHLNYDEFLQRNLRALDATAISLCRDNSMPIVVFSADIPGALLAAARGETIGTRISAQPETGG